MIKSMTGFGSMSKQKKKFSVAIQISSVNRSYLDIDISINGKDYLFLLPEIREVVKKNVKRGKIQVYVSIDALSHTKNITFNAPLAKSIMTKVRSWEKELFKTYSLTSGDVLKLDGILTVKANSLKNLRLKPGVLETLKQTLGELDKMRIREGVHIKKEFLTFLKKIEKHLGVIEKCVPLIEKRHEKKLITRLKNSKKTRDFSSEEKDMMMKMLGLFTEKTDIAEEISRLKSHIKQFRRCMTKDDKPGKTLNFIAQEMLREANTIGSKTPAIEVKQKVIHIKALIEEIKEQVSNVE
ncbi:MAG: YicC family protein [Candidatus Aureabacteria bacterium]|nr:YicC family protein [Candidatus Auribacterota bacterium]